MPRPVEGHSPYNPGLDGLRAVAVLGVVAYHLGVGWAPGGLLGVDVFFVLSGYLITDLLVAEHGRSARIALGRFWQRRARRLLPALLVMLAVSVAFATLFDHAELPGMRSDLLPAIFYYSNWWDIFHNVSYFAQFGPPAAFNHLWSLAVEEQFYLVWPVVLVLALRFVRSRTVLAAAMAVAAAASAIEMGLLYSPLADPTRVYDGTDTRAFALLIGACLAVLWPRGSRFVRLSERGRRVLDGVGVGALAVILAFFWRVGEYDPFAYRGGMVLLSLATAVLIAVCVHPDTRIGRVLGTAPLRWVGERSYGVYLWQLPVIVLTTPQGAQPATWRDILQVAAILALSAASWRFVEEPVRHGALGSIGAAVRRGGWPAVRPSDRRGWALAGGATAGALVCLLGLTGAVSGALGGSGPEGDVLPPVLGGHTPGDPTTSTRPYDVTTTTVEPATAGTTTTTAPSGQGVTAIGDSVLVDATTDLQRMLPGIVIDAQVGQQLTQVEADLPALKAAGDIGQELILEMGTNGYYTVTQLQTLLRTIGPMKRIVLVNTRETRPWEQAVNQTIDTVAHSWPGAILVDWYDASATDPQYFYPDGVHLDPTGAKAYAMLIVSALESPAPAPTTTTTAAPASSTGPASPSSTPATRGPKRTTTTGPSGGPSSSRRGPASWFPIGG